MNSSNSKAWLATTLRFFAQTHRQRLVAQGQKAGWFQPDNGNARLGQRQHIVNQRGEFCPGAIHHAGGQEGAAAAMLAVRLADQI